MTAVMQLVVQLLSKFWHLDSRGIGRAFPRMNYKLFAMLWMAGLLILMMLPVITENSVVARAVAVFAFVGALSSVGNFSSALRS